ncbi:MAG TPA: hypothetical protein VH593_01625 [Ktedonobacteraceae bacterium]|jgi:hypothetical protein
MASHRFAVLTEQGKNGVTSPEFEALFAPDVVLNSPFLLKPLDDKKLTVRFLSEIFAAGGYPRYTHQFTDDQQTTLFLWEGDVQGPDGRVFTLEGSLAITEGEDGLIHKVVSYLRPLQVGALLIKDMVVSAASALPKEYWEAVKPQSAK